MNLPKGKLENFDGQIGHVIDGATPSSFFLYVVPTVSSVVNGKVDEAIASCVDSIQPIPCSDNLESGRIYVLRVEGRYERAWFSKYLSEDNQTVQMILVDKGLERQVERDAVLSCPVELAAIDVFGVMCPVLITNATEDVRSVARKLIGRKCRCIAEQAVNEPPIMPYMKGRILIEYESGGYAELKDIGLKPIEGKECAKFIIECEKRENRLADLLQQIHKVVGQTCCTTLFSSAPAARRPLDSLACFISVNSTGCVPSRPFGNMATKSGPPSRNRIYDDRGTDEHDQVPPSIGGSIFKEFEPNVYPKLVRVRYVKQDQEMSLAQFWAVDPSTFTTVERVLYEGRDRYGDLCTMDRAPLQQLAGLGCLVRVSVDDGSRVSVYLVDFGLFKWARGIDLLDISSLNADDPALSIHVSMFRCRMEQTAPMRVQDLVKGYEYELLIMSRGSDGVFVVTATLVGGLLPSSLPNHGNMMQNLIGNTGSVTHRCGGDRVMQTLTNFFGTQLQVDGNLRNNNQISSANLQPATANSVTPNTSPLAQFPGYGLPYVIPVAVPVPMPVRTTVTEGEQNRIGAQSRGGECVDSSRRNQDNCARGRNTSFEWDPQLRNHRFRRDQWRGGNGGGVRSRQFGTYEEGNQREGSSFGGFGGRGDGPLRGADFDKEGRRGGSFWKRRCEERQMRRGSMEASGARGGTGIRAGSAFESGALTVWESSNSRDFVSFLNVHSKFIAKATLIEVWGPQPCKIRHLYGPPE
ncbi:unnamed protein product [Toxocara canis]|uniref:Tudor domain-containing protein n=1 Tax=Toxocara canis TaxID=6265 RepID=A0A183UKP6_TOXCA|nr:unnamed protein product [Toxocara canis]